MRAMAAMAATVLLACGGSKQPAPAEELAGGDAGRLALPPGPDEPPPPPYGAEVVSLRLKRSIVVRNGADETAKAIGTIAQDTRVKWTAWQVGPGCKGLWIEIAPRGWVCDRYLEPSSKKPDGVELPKVKAGELLPGKYGKVVAAGADVYQRTDDIEKKRAPARKLAGAVKVRLIEMVEADNQLWWRTLEGEYIQAKQVEVLTPSTFAGVKDPKLPMAWAQAKAGRKQRVVVRDVPGGAQTKTLAPRAVVRVAETTGDGKWIRIGDGWVAADDLRVARLAAPPPSTRGNERWLDVDLDEQVVVAYEGEKPVFATLVSSGAKKWPTATGIYRIWIKFAETDMNGQMGDEAPYSVSQVPWTMFFAKDLAFHTAYWHDDFGERRSHGCLNLSPRDARTLYFWATPDVPPGWSMAHGILERPGAQVRIRSKADPEPGWKGYAKEVFERRNGGAKR